MAVMSKRQKRRFLEGCSIDDSGSNKSMKEIFKHTVSGCLKSKVFIV